MASTDYPLSVSSKFIDDAGTEHLVTVRGRNLEDFHHRLQESGQIFPYAAFSTVGNGRVAPSAVNTPPGDAVPASVTPITASPPASIPPDMSRTPANHPDRAPKYANHNSPMRPSKDGGWFCPRKNEDNTFCQVRAA